MSEQWGAAVPPTGPQQQNGGQWAQPAPDGSWPQPGQVPGQAPGQPAPDSSWPQPGQVPPQQGGWPQQPGAAPQPQQNAWQQPQQPQPGFGVDPSAGGYPGGPYGPGYNVQPPKQSNGLALAGAITSWVPLVGLVLSIIGFARSKALAGAGRTAATVGIILGVLFTGGAGFGIYKVAGSTAADPACLSSEAAMRSMESKLNADEQKLNSDSSSGDDTAALADLKTATDDLQSVKTQIDGDLQKATHANVKAALQKVDADLGEMITDFQKISNGDDSGATDLSSKLSQMESDGNAVDSLCGNVTNG
jgi:hypothetical protein